MHWKPFYIEEQVHIDTLFSMFIEKQPKGFRFPGETHDFWECLYLLEGSACISADDRVYQLSEGDLIFHKPMELHQFHIDQDPGASLLIFSFTLSGPRSGYFKNKVFHLTDEQKNILEELLQYVRTQVHPLENLPDAKKEEQFLSTAQESPLYLHRIVTYLHQLLLSLGDTGSITRASTTSDALVFQQAVQYMAAHIHTCPTVLEIAQHCSLSESGLKRLFAKYAGLSVHKYFLKLKFKTAGELLQNGMNVSEVSELLNFSSQSYFSVSFKRETGKNPSQLK